MPIVPGLLVFAAFGLITFFNNLVAGKFSSVISYGALLAVSTLFVSWPQSDPSLWALDAYNSGWQALESGDLVLGRQRKLEIARSYVPDNAETNFALGNLKLAQNDPATASVFYFTTCASFPLGIAAQLTISVFSRSKMDGLTSPSNGFARPSPLMA